MSTPRILYRYRSMQERHELTALEEGYLWFSYREQLNDPFEMMAKLETKLPCHISEPDKVIELFKRQGASDEEARNALNGNDIAWKLNQQQKNWRKSSRQLYKDYRDKTLICCFTELPDNLLMWSHYAGALTGVCLGFDTKALCGVDTDPDDFFKVSYPKNNKVPIVDISSLYQRQRKCDSDIEAINGVLSKLFAVKSSAWKYEEEWRVLSYIDADGNKCFYQREALKEVVFGEFIDKTIEQRIRQILSKDIVEFKKAIRDESNYKLNIIKA